MTTRQPNTTDVADAHNPWPALWALALGFFMILVDTTIVSVAMPAIMEGLDAGVNAVIWVTSAYLLAYAVPLLITGRLGDRFGPKRLYMAGLALFTLASLWCGFTGTIEQLIIARVFQGFGASMITPQTMAVITRTFPATNRGQAMGLWGATAGVATLVGPIMGGLLVDGPGWEWIFFINVPVGIFGLYLAWRLVPDLETHSHSFDLVGVALSAIGMFCLVFGIQEGQTYNWGVIAGPLSVWSLIGGGLLFMAVFIFWQSRIKTEPLVPLRLFRDRNFSLANVGITTVGFAVTAMAFPFMLYAQIVRGMSPTHAAFLLIPMAVLSGGLAPWVGKLVDRMHPSLIAGIGLSSATVALAWLGLVMTPTSAIWELLLPITLLGIANGFMWSPLSTTATRNLPMHSAGAGAGIYNTTRQIGAVLGSAGIAALIQARLAVYLPGMPSNISPTSGGQKMPAEMLEGFSSAMGESLYLPAAVIFIGLIAALAFERPAHLGTRPRKTARTDMQAASDRPAS